MKVIRLKTKDALREYTLNALFVPHTLGRLRVGAMVDTLLKAAEDEVPADGAVYGIYADGRRTWIGRGCVLAPFFERLAEQFLDLSPNFTFQHPKYVLYVILPYANFRVELVSVHSTSETLIPDTHLANVVRNDVEKGVPLLCTLFGVTSLDEAPVPQFRHERSCTTLRFKTEAIDELLDEFQVRGATMSLLRRGYPTRGVLRGVAGAFGLAVLVGMGVMMKGVFFASSPTEKISLVPEGGWGQVAEDVIEKVLPEEAQEYLEDEVEDEVPNVGRSSRRWDMAVFGELVESAIWRDLEVSSIAFSRDHLNEVRIEVSSYAPDREGWLLLPEAWDATWVSDGGQGVVKYVAGGFDRVSVDQDAGGWDPFPLCENAGGEFERMDSPGRSRCTLSDFHVSDWQRNMALLDDGRLAHAKCEFDQRWWVTTSCVLEFVTYQENSEVS